MNRITSRRGLAALGLGLAIAMSAGIYASSAQTGPRALPSSPEYQDRAVEPQDRQFDRAYGPNDRDSDRFARPEDRLERRLAFLHGQLRITPAQERGWQAFAAVMRDEARDRVRDRSEDRERFRAPSVVERLEDRQRRLAERRDDLERVLRTLRPVYASFSAEQRRTADRLMFQPGGDGRGFGNGRIGGSGFDRGGPPDRPDRDRDDRRDRDYRPGDNRF